MDRHSSEPRQQAPARSAADSLRKDFDELVAIFDRQLSKIPHSSSPARTRVSEAKLAAERGRRLSNELSELLRKPS